MENDAASRFPFHAEYTAAVNAPAEVVFTYLDDPRRSSAHMSKSSWMMAGSSIVIDLDAGEGRVEGAGICLTRHIFSISPSLDEIVTERVFPRRKFWQATGTPRLLVIGHYQMGFAITPERSMRRMRVFFDYALPEAPIAHCVSAAFAGVYARCCTRRMVVDAIEHVRSLRDQPDPGASEQLPTSG